MPSPPNFSEPDPTNLSITTSMPTILYTPQQVKFAEAIRLKIASEGRIICSKSRLESMARNLCRSMYLSQKLTQFSELKKFNKMNPMNGYYVTCEMVKMKTELCMRIKLGKN
jgi:hypothetical protein